MKIVSQSERRSLFKFARRLGGRPKGSAARTVQLCRAYTPACGSRSSDFEGQNNEDERPRGAEKCGSVKNEGKFYLTPPLRCSASSRQAHPRITKAARPFHLRPHPPRLLARLSAFFFLQPQHYKYRCARPFVRKGKSVGLRWIFTHADRSVVCSITTDL